MKAMNGGYTMIDCAGIELTTGDKQTITGIYNQVKTAYKADKQVIACNLTFAAGKVTPVSVMINPEPGSDTGYIATASTLQLWIGADDGVTVVNMAPTANRSAAKASK